MAFVLVNHWQTLISVYFRSRKIHEAILMLRQIFTVN
ncbi:TPA: hypothetical protein HMU92_09475 [Escherichia coli]|nr:hypothetical protein [Escherichia coli]